MENRREKVTHRRFAAYGEVSSPLAARPKGYETPVNPWLVLWSIACLAGVALSVRSVTVLRSRSPWTMAGWCFTTLYFAVGAIDALRARPAPAHLDYAALALLAVAFVVAGFRDEPQAEPWWWPSLAGPTGRERAEQKKRS